LFYRLTSTQFNDFFKICSLIQDFIFISKYNLKRTNISNRNILLCVCSCASKKKTQEKSLLNITDNDSSHLEENLELNKTQQEKVIKRDNIRACYFRIKFKRNQKGSDFQLVSKGNFLHNHPPAKSKDKYVSKKY
jgi:hypothetical protein